MHRIKGRGTSIALLPQLTPCSQHRHASEALSPGKVEGEGREGQMSLGSKGDWINACSHSTKCPCLTRYLSLASMTACRMQQLGTSSRWSCPHALSAPQDKEPAKRRQGGTETGLRDTNGNRRRQMRPRDISELPTHTPVSRLGLRFIEGAPWELHAFQGGL